MLVYVRTTLYESNLPINYLDWTFCVLRLHNIVDRRSIVSTLFMLLRCRKHRDYVETTDSNCGKV